MKRFMRVQRFLAVVGLSILALAGTKVARADVIMPDSYTLYLSAPGTNTVAGIAYSDEDVLRYSPTMTPKWAMHFDGSAAGLPAAADIDAYDYDYKANTFTSWHYMSFDQPITVPGLGVVDDSDIILYKTTLLSSTWSLFFDGSAYGLATDSEDIDGLEISAEGSIFLSTMGGFNVPALDNTIIKGTDQDYLYWTSSENAYIWHYKGTDIGIAADNDLFNLALASPEGERNISLLSFMLFSVQKAAKVQGLSAGAFDILIEQRSPSSLDYAMLWDASASGFPKVDAIDVRLFYN